jgi:chromosome segregation ATPase
MTLQDITAKVTGLEPRITALEEAKETAEQNSASIQAELTEARNQLSAITGERDTLKDANATLTQERDTLAGEVKELKDTAETVKQAASAQAVDIVAGQGAEPAPEADNVEGSAGAVETIAQQYAKLEGAERVSFFRKHKAELIKTR